MTAKESKFFAGTNIPKLPKLSTFLDVQTLSTHSDDGISLGAVIQFFLKKCPLIF